MIRTLQIGEILKHLVCTFQNVPGTEDREVDSKGTRFSPNSDLVDELMLMFTFNEWNSTPGEMQFSELGYEKCNLFFAVSYCLLNFPKKARQHSVKPACDKDQKCLLQGARMRLRLSVQHHSNIANKHINKIGSCCFFPRLFLR